VLESSRVAGVLPSMVSGLKLHRRHMADGRQEPALVEPVDPLQGGVFDLVQAPPWATPADQLGLVQADDRLGQGVVVGVAAGADRDDRAGSARRSVSRMDSYWLPLSE
jgi:hypothetical protein